MSDQNGEKEPGAEAYALEASRAVFGVSGDRFEEMVSWLESQEAAELTHAGLETQLQLRGRELLRQLTQDYLDRRASRERRLVEVVKGRRCPAQ